MLGDNIKKIMKEKNVSAKKISDEINISATYLSYILNGKRKNPSMKTLQKIADILNVSVNDFFNESNINEIKDQKENKFSKNELLLLERIKTLTPEKVDVILKMIDVFDKEDKNK